MTRDMREARAASEDGLQGRRERKEKPGVRYMAAWSSAPDFAWRSWTTSALDGVPAISLCEFVEDEISEGVSSATVWSLRMRPEARVREIETPADWQELVERFPCDVTGTHDGEWRDWGGVPGPWRLPDWEQVAEHYDGVHVTTGGYLASCGLAMPAAGGFTMLAGWIPDATLWLTDVTAHARRLGHWHGGPLVHGPAGLQAEIDANWRPAG